jgi:outer membrane lipoprotein LolB
MSSTRNWLAVMMLLLSACSLTPPEPVIDPVLATEPPEHWTARGRFSYRGESSRNGQFDWQQRGDSFEVRLFGTFGLGAVRIWGDSDRVMIESGGETYYSDQPELLLFQLTGLDMPVAELAGWMTASGKSSNGWQVTPTDFRREGDFVLPSRLDLNRDEVNLRIAIMSWILDSDS